MKKAFNISAFELPRHVIPSIKGYAEDIFQAVQSFGLKHKQPEIMDFEFVTNMGTLLTALSYMATAGVERDVNWRFSQYGLLYTPDVKTYLMKHRGGSSDYVNSIEFAFAIGMTACQENMAWAINEGFKNPFRMSFFYYNFLDAHLDHLPKEQIDASKVRRIVMENESKAFVPYKHKLESLLDIPVTPTEYVT